MKARVPANPIAEIVKGRRRARRHPPPHAHRVDNCAAHSEFSSRASGGGAPIPHLGCDRVEGESLQDGTLPSSFRAVRSSCARGIEELLFPADSAALDGGPIRPFPRYLWSHGSWKIQAFRSSKFRWKL